MTTFEYDDDGRLARAVTVRESEFSPWDRLSLLKNVSDEKAPRGPHGLLISEVSDPDNQFAFEVPAPTMDWAQKALDDAQDAYRKKNPKASLGSLLWRVQRRE